MEHRHELEQILLNGLSAPERAHVVTTIRAHDTAKLRRLRAQRVDSHVVAVTGPPGANGDDVDD